MQQSHKSQDYVHIMLNILIKIIQTITGTVQWTVMQIKTSCGPSSQSEDQISFTFCQKGKCCTTGKLPPQNEKCKVNEYQDQKIGECAQFEFTSEPFVGNVTYSNQSATDGWNPEWVKLFQKNGTKFTCSLDGRIDGNDGVGIGIPKLDFYCYPGGQRRVSKNLVAIAMALFMFSVCIVITNILIGLTVSRVDYFMKKADTIRLEKTSLECQRWSKIKASSWNIFYDVRRKMLKKNIKITITSVSPKSECRGAWDVGWPLRIWYYWITKKFVEAQG